MITNIALWYHYEFDGPDVESIDSSLLFAYVFATNEVRGALIEPQPEYAYNFVKNTPANNDLNVSDFMSVDDGDGEYRYFKSKVLWTGSCRATRRSEHTTTTDDYAQGVLIAVNYDISGQVGLYFSFASKKGSRYLYDDDYVKGITLKDGEADEDGVLWFEKSVLREDGTLSVRFLISVQLWRTHFRVENAEAEITCKHADDNNNFVTILKETIVGERTIIWETVRSASLNIRVSRTSNSIALIEVYRNGKRIAIGAQSVALTDVTFLDDDVFEIKGLTTKQVYAPLFADINAPTGQPLFSDMAKRTFWPLYATLGAYFISYSFLDKSHLWTRISTINSNTASAVPDSCFIGRNSRYDGSSGDVGKNIRPVFYELATLGGIIHTSVTLYFFCALCNWGCSSDYEFGDVDFVVLWKAFTVRNIPRATSANPGPGNETFAFSVTITIARNGNRYWPTGVSIKDKDGNIY